MATRTFTALIEQDDATSGCGIRLPFNPKDAFGKVRSPVVATVGGHSFRTTTCSMGGAYWIPLNRANRDAIGAKPGQKVTVRLELDDTPRVIEAPSDLVAALKAAGALGAWKKLSFTHQREHVEAIEEAKKPETRARRIARAVEAVGG